MPQGSQIKLIFFFWTFLFCNTSIAQFEIKKEILIGDDIKSAVDLRFEPPKNSFFFRVKFKNSPNKVEYYPRELQAKGGQSFLCMQSDKIEEIEVLLTQKYRGMALENSKIFNCSSENPVFFKSEHFVRNSKYANKFSPSESDLFFGREASGEFLIILNDLLNNIGFTGINLSAYQGNVESFAEHFEFFTEENGFQNYRINLFYNEEYFRNLLENGRINEVRIIILHELGHFIKNSYSGKKAELEADRFAGFMMGSRFHQNINESQLMESGQLLFKTFEMDDFYPTIEERLESLLTGWRESKNNLNSSVNSFLSMTGNYRGENSSFISQYDSLLSIHSSDTSFLADRQKYLTQYEFAKFWINNSEEKVDKWEAYHAAQDALSKLKSSYDKNLIDFFRIEVQYIYFGEDGFFIPQWPNEIDFQKLDNYQLSLWYYLKGVEMVKKRDFNAVDILRKSIDLDKSNPNAYYFLALSIYEKDPKDWFSAKEELEKFRLFENSNQVRNIKKKDVINLLTRILKNGINESYEGNNFLKTIELLEFYTLSENQLTLDPDLVIKRTISYLELEEYEKAILSLQNLFAPGIDNLNLKNSINKAILTMERNNDPRLNNFKKELISKSISI